jgi:hypothetical protein
MSMESIHPKQDNPLAWRRSITSQWGEDGVIEEIFRRIGEENRYCVEFGAWDGEYLSNVWHLWHDLNWNAVLIEGDTKRFTSLQSKVALFARVIPVHKFVAGHGENCLDQILLELKVPKRVDLVSIDIDSDDYYVFEGLRQHTPRVLIIEYNPTIPPHLDVVQAEHEYFGASALALVKLASTKGYGLVGCTQSNCIFVLRSEYEKLGIAEPRLSEVFPHDHLTYVITAQDGRAFLTRKPTYSHLKRTGAWQAAVNRLRRNHRLYPRLRADFEPIPIELEPIS